MKFLKLSSVIIVLSILLCSCKSSIPELEKIAFSIDLTHDGKNEKVVVSINDADTSDAYVKIYTSQNKKDVLIWEDTAGTKKKAQKGIYVCKKLGNFDLLVWKPTYDGNTTTLEYRVFYFGHLDSDNRIDELEEVERKITFTKEEVKKDGTKYQEATEFVTTLNSYLEKSVALLDTVGGEVHYSKSTKEKAYNLYYPDWFDKDYKPSSDSSSNTNSKND